MKTNMLRLAAHLLIAHFLVSTALAFAATGGPDTQRLLMTFALLVVSVGALFRPRSKGWIVVVAYVLYVVVYQLIGIWSAAGTIAAMPPVGKATVVVISVLLIGLPLAALAMVLLPANFAAFARAPAGADAEKAAHPAPARAAAATAKPGAGPSATLSEEASRTSRKNAVILGAVVALAAIAAGYVYLTRPDPQWLTSSEYQREFDTRARGGFYPHEVAGECRRGADRFRADWRTTPAGASFFAHHGMTRQDYDRRNQEYAAKGYAPVTTRQFRDCAGNDRYQATWLRR